jgi:general secretion pathway protein G
MRKQKGFTLIELLVVIAIIGLLSTLAVVALNNARAKSRDAKRVADIKQMQTALELFFNDCSSYPVSADLDLDDAGRAALTALGSNCSNGETFGDYMAQIPEFPTPYDGTCTDVQNEYTYNSTDATGADCAVAPCASYTIQYCLGAQTGGLDAGEHFGTPSGM